nr:PREDICTED: interferon-inducible GTPase 5-like [Latimeria chalumnae]|eukprot:XP_014343710.1 PREDICTED: interferon-inducible GTPase 5-like [Latimeria chalumnae]
MQLTDEYLQQVNFSQYDFFIIIASDRFKGNDAKLAHEIQKMGKKFYFVRSKIGQDIYASKKQRKSTFNEEMILEEIRQDCIKCLQKEGVESPRVHLLSIFELNKFDFYSLTHEFLLSLLNISVKIFEKKVKPLKKMIWQYAFRSLAGAVVQVPGLSIEYNLLNLKKAIETFRCNLGLDDESLQKLAKKVNKSTWELKSVVKYQTRSISFATIFGLLKNILKELEEDGKNVLIKAFEH